MGLLGEAEANVFRWSELVESKLVTQQTRQEIAAQGMLLVQLRREAPSTFHGQIDHLIWRLATSHGLTVANRRGGASH